jgi:hypothetical protein
MTLTVLPKPRLLGYPDLERACFVLLELAAAGGPGRQFECASLRPTLSQADVVGSIPIARSLPPSGHPCGQGCDAACRTGG